MTPMIWRFVLGESIQLRWRVYLRGNLNVQTGFERGALRTRSFWMGYFRLNQSTSFERL